MLPGWVKLFESNWAHRMSGENFRILYLITYMKKYSKSIITSFAIVLLAGGGLFYWIGKYDNKTNKDRIVIDPESGQFMLNDELVILNSDADINAVIKKYNGIITFSVPETSTYQVRFPVSSYGELSDIKDRLNNENKGKLSASYVLLIMPPNPGEPQ